VSSFFFFFISVAAAFGLVLVCCSWRLCHPAVIVVLPIPLWYYLFCSTVNSSVEFSSGYNFSEQLLSVKLRLWGRNSLLYSLTWGYHISGHSVFFQLGTWDYWIWRVWIAELDFCICERSVFVSVGFLFCLTHSTECVLSSARICLSLQEILLRNHSLVLSWAWLDSTALIFGTVIFISPL